MTLLTALQFVNGSNFQGLVMLLGGTVAGGTLVYLLTRSKDSLMIAVSAALFLLPILLRVVR